MAGELAELGWWLIAIATVVVLVVTALTLLPLRRRVRGEGETTPAGGGLAGVTPSDRGGTTALVAATGAAGVLLLGTFLYNVATLGRTAAPSDTPSLTIEVVGHQWWWEIRYLDRDSTEIAVTANEFHIPVGEPVRLVVRSADVIHSFWVPRLHGKIDLVPGRSNVFWLQADRPGRYRGQCAEYCGLQHAHMGLYVTADPPREFAAWLERESGPAADPVEALAERGRTEFANSACAQCHTIRGVSARDLGGPDLTHLAGRRTIAAGMYPNDRAHLSAWIVDAPSLKPGTAMPEMALEPAKMRAIVAYLETLR